MSFCGPGKAKQVAGATDSLDVAIKLTLRPCKLHPEIQHHAVIATLNAAPNLNHV